MCDFWYYSDSFKTEKYIACFPVVQRNLERQGTNKTSKEKPSENVRGFREYNVLLLTGM